MRYKTISIPSFCIPASVGRQERECSQLVMKSNGRPQFRCVCSLFHASSVELPGERDNARNNARCTQARKTTHGLDEQHQDVDGRVS